MQEKKIVPSKFLEIFKLRLPIIIVGGRGGQKPWWKVSKYGPEKTPYFDTFQAVFSSQDVL